MVGTWKQQADWPVSLTYVDFDKSRTEERGNRTLERRPIGDRNRRDRQLPRCLCSSPLWHARCHIVGIGSVVTCRSARCDRLTGCIRKIRAGALILCGWRRLLARARAVGRRKLRKLSRRSCRGRIRFFFPSKRALSLSLGRNSLPRAYDIASVYCVAPCLRACLALERLHGQPFQAVLVLVGLQQRVDAGVGLVDQQILSRARRAAAHERTSRVQRGVQHESRAPRTLRCFIPREFSRFQSSSTSARNR